MSEVEHIRRCIETKTCHCGEPLDVSPDLSRMSACGGEWWMVTCPACYDGEGSPIGCAATREAAVQEWADDIDPWPELAECSACEQVVTANRATAATHHGYGYPICDECMDAP